MKKFYLLLLFCMGISSVSYSATVFSPVIDFNDFELGQNMGRKFQAGWWNFETSGRNISITQEQNNLPHLKALSWHDNALSIVPTKTGGKYFQSAQLQVLMGSPGTLKIVAYNSLGSEIGTHYVEYGEGAKYVNFKVPGDTIKRIVLSSDDYPRNRLFEGQLWTMSGNNIAQPQRTLNDAISELRRTNERFNTYVENNPELLTIAQARLGLLSSMSESTVASEFRRQAQALNDDEASGSNGGSGNGITWPPEWDCLLNNILIDMVIGAIIEDLGISRLARAAAVVAVTSIFPISPVAAGLLYDASTQGYYVYSLLKECSA